jgi:propionyl-CoA synthetase
LGISGPCSWPTIVVAGLPKTRSGKIPRGTMRRIADGEDYPMPATIDDPAVLGEIAEALHNPGTTQKGAADFRDPDCVAHADRD